MLCNKAVPAHSMLATARSMGARPVARYRCFSASSLCCLHDLVVGRLVMFFYMRLEKHLCNAMSRGLMVHEYIQSLRMACWALRGRWGLSYSAETRQCGNVVVLSAQLGCRTVLLFTTTEEIHLNAMMSMLMLHMVVRNMSRKAGGHLFWILGQCIIYVCLFLYMYVCMSAYVFSLFSLSLCLSLSLSLSLSLCIYTYIYIQLGHGC
jgi:hypothetical protein